MRKKDRQIKKTILDYFGFFGRGESGLKIENRLRRNKKEGNYIREIKDLKLLP